MKYILTTLTALSCILAPSAALANGATPGNASEYKFSADSYTRLRVRMDYSEKNDINVFQGKHCPENNILGLDILELVKGDSSAALSVVIDAPMISNLDLNLYSITIDRGLFSIDCNSSFKRIDFQSPLYHGADYAGKKISVTPKFVSEKNFNDLLIGPMDTVSKFASSLSPLPSGFLENKNKKIEGPTLNRQIVSDTYEFTISGDRTTQSWIIPEDKKNKIPAIKITAYFETVPSYFSKSGGNWDPYNILSRSFPSGSQFGYATFRDFAAGMGNSYTGMIAATDLSAFNANCETLRDEISRQGLIPMDRSLLLWAVARNATNMKDDRRIDHTNCMKSVFAELSRFEETKDIVPRGDVWDEKPASINQMQLTVDGNTRLRSFFRTNDWDIRFDASRVLFTWPLKYSDLADTNLMKDKQIDLTNDEQWLTKKYPGSGIQFARNVGCYTYMEGKNNGKSYMLAVADFGTADAPMEKLLHLTFDNIPSTQASGRISMFEIMSANSNPSYLKEVQNVYGSSGCEGGEWKPAILGFVPAASPE